MIIKVRFDNKLHVMVKKQKFCPFCHFNFLHVQFSAAREQQIGTPLTLS